jgi:hypothetical protein
LDEQLTKFMFFKGYKSTDEIPPNEFVTWVFPYLFQSRLPRYQAVADQYGYTIDATDVANISGEADFIQVIADALAR